MALKVYDLQCEHGHVFEGWFASPESYEEQRTRGLLSCPVCDSHEVVRKLSASRINMGRSRQEPQAVADPMLPQAASEAVAAPGTRELAQLQAQVLRYMRRIVRNTEDVGAGFAQEARRIHAGEAEERSIRGTATPEEREALMEEGIAVMPIPDFLDEDRLQ